jgi:hypothetical protein
VEFEILWNNPMMEVDYATGAAEMGTERRTPPRNPGRVRTRSKVLTDGRGARRLDARIKSSHSAQS